MSHHAPHPRRLCCALALALATAFALCAGVSPVRADDSASARADALFRDGKARLAQNDFAQACPLFAQSFEAEAATGTLLALAICHERAGKLASAVHEYKTVAERSKAESRADREAASLAKAAALEPQLSQLTLSLGAQPPALQLTLDGIALDAAAWTAPIAVDGGAHRIEALVEGKSRWSAELTFADRGETKAVNVPTLLPAPAPELVPPPPVVHIAKSMPRDVPQAKQTPGRSAGQWAGLITLGAAAVSCGVGTVFAIVAANDNTASRASCDGDLCTRLGHTQRLDARSAGNASTASFMLAGAMATVGAALFFATGRSESSERAYSVGPWAAPHAAGADLRGAF